MSDLVSVIIPVYNLQDYIASCLQSLQNQTYPHWEAICVDDGSADDSGEIIRALAQQDTRIRYIHQENAGVSAARNAGLAHAAGVYICFVDGDDFLHPQFLSMTVPLMDTYDLAAAGYVQTAERNLNFPAYEPTEPKALDFEAFYRMNGDLNANMLGKTVWGKLFRREIAQAFSFPVGVSYSEDMHYLGKVLSLHPRLCYLDVPLYGYFVRSSSAVHASFSPQLFTAVQTMHALCLYLEAREEPFLMGQAMRNLYANLLRIRNHSRGTPYQKQIFRESRQIGRRWLGTWLRNPSNSWKHRVFFALCFFSDRCYEWGRTALDPTMKAHFRAKRKRQNQSPDP